MFIEPWCWGENLRGSYLRRDDHSSKSDPYLLNDPLKVKKNQVRSWPNLQQKLILNVKGATNKWANHVVFHNCTTRDGQNPKTDWKIENHCNEDTYHELVQDVAYLKKKICSPSSHAEVPLNVGLSLPHTSLLVHQPSGIQVPKTNIRTWVLLDLNCKNSAYTRAWRVYGIRYTHRPVDVKVCNSSLHFYKCPV